MTTQPLRRRLIGLWIALAAILAASAAPAAREGAPIVKTADGLLSGKLDAGVRQFLGVPYAAAPVGDLRWKPPRPAPAWTGLRSAAALGDKCLQTTWSPPIAYVGAEDCLYLNVYAPKPSSRALVPVMVWFHGGGWVNGSSQDVDGHVFAAKGVIVVTVNYRLGAMGFFASPLLDAESASRVSGNYALLDQQAALRWVQRNIRQFGGDPRRVTIAGQSAGALSNWIHLVAPSSRALFNQVIAESPVVSLHPEAGLDDARGLGGTKTLQQEEAAGTSAHLARALGCDGASDPLACLRARPAQEIAEAMKPGAAGWGVGWTPVADGLLLPGAAPTLIRQGRFKAVPILTGGNWGENGIFSLRKVAFGQPFYTQADYERLVLALPHGADILAQYPARKFASPEDAYIIMRGDARVCTNISTARALSAHSPLYLYQFEDEHPPATLYAVEAPADVHPQAFHTAEIAYVFQTGYPNELHPGAPPFTAAQKRLSQEMIDDWVGFVKTGRPPAASHWKPFAASRQFQLLSPLGVAQVSAERLAAQHNCGFWFTLWRD